MSRKATKAQKHAESANPHKFCFVISEIGRPDELRHHRAKDVLDFIIRPALKDVFRQIERADDERAPGDIPSQVYVSLQQADLVIADLTGFNPNVFLELGVRWALNLPSVTIFDSEEPLPFDVQNWRTVQFDSRRPSLVEKAKIDIRAAAAAQLDDARNASPVATALSTHNVKLHKPVDAETITSLVGIVSKLEMEVRTLKRTQQSENVLQSALTSLRGVESPRNFLLHSGRPLEVFRFEYPGIVSEQLTSSMTDVSSGSNAALRPPIASGMLPPGDATIKKETDEKP